MRDVDRVVEGFRDASAGYAIWRCRFTPRTEVCATIGALR